MTQPTDKESKPTLEALLEQLRSEPEWEYRDILGMFHVTRDGDTQFVVENQRAAAQACESINATVRRLRAVAEALEEANKWVFSETGRQLITAKLSATPNPREPMT